MLENAIVVVLSDHGEALGGRDRFDAAQDGHRLRDLGFALGPWHERHEPAPVRRRARDARLSAARRCPGRRPCIDWPVSLEDVRPTLEEFATGQAHRRTWTVFRCCRSSRTRRRPRRSRHRVRFTETGFQHAQDARRQATTNRASIDEGGRLLRDRSPNPAGCSCAQNRLPELMAQKQRAAMSRKTHCWPQFRAGRTAVVTYLFTDRRHPLPRALRAAPDPAAEPEAARLWDALQARFPGELAADS